MNKVALGINIFNTPQLQKCKENLLKLKSKMDLYCLQNSKDQINDSGFRRINCIRTIAKDIVPGSVSKKPLIYEMMDGLSDTGRDYFLFMNSDIILSEEAIDWILNQKKYTSACFSRVDFEPVERRNFESCAPYGFDVFLIKSSWWKEHRTEFLNIPNIYAEPCWDLAYATTLHIKSSCYFHNKIPLTYHICHKGRWSIDTPEGGYNQNKFNGTILIHLWNEYFVNTVLSRKYVNGTIDSDRIKVELEVEKRVFGR